MTANPEWMHKTLRAQLDQWTKVEELWKTCKNPAMNVVTVSRQAGSGGRLVAARVAQELDLHFYDRAIIQRIAEISQTTHQVVKSRDEKGPSILDHWIDSLVNQRGLWPGSYIKKNVLAHTDYIRHLKFVLAEINNGNGGVVLGRGANFFLPSQRCLRVRIVAPEEQRVAGLARVLDTDQSHARRMVREKAAARRSFVKQAFGRELDDPTAYDMVLNMDCLGLEDAVAAILHTWQKLRNRQGSPGTA